MLCVQTNQVAPCYPAEHKFRLKVFYFRRSYYSTGNNPRSWHKVRRIRETMSRQHSDDYFSLIGDDCERHFIGAKMRFAKLERMTVYGEFC